MAEYVEREKVIKILEEQFTGTYKGTPVYSAEIDRARTLVYDLDAADVAPVVRCKDCEFSHMDGWFCGGAGMMPAHTTLPESFCDHGERKEGDGDA